MKQGICSIKSVKVFVIANKKLYFIGLISAVLGITLGIILSFTGGDGKVYSQGGVTLYEIIVSDYSGFSLFFDNIYRLLIPIVLIFLFTLSKYSMPLTYVYLGYQGYLLGASIVGLITNNGAVGLLNGLILVLPINAINFFIIISALVVFIKRLNLKTYQRITLVHSVKIFIPKLLWVVVGAILTSFIYAFLYPLLLKSMIVINY